MWVVILMEALVKLKGPYAIAGGGGGKVWFSYSPSFHFTSFLIPSFALSYRSFCLVQVVRTLSIYHWKRDQHATPTINDIIKEENIEIASHPFKFRMVVTKYF